MARICGKMSALLNRKDLKLTTFAIIGGGIAGRSLLFHLAKSGIPFQKIYLFSSDRFAKACSLNSTAIVARRGVSSGLSNLGDILSESFDLFVSHFEKDSPQGIQKVTQFTGASSKIDQFKKRYPKGELGNTLGPLETTKDFYHASEEAFMIDPQTYLDWLLEESKSLPLEFIDDFVTSIQAGANLGLRTQGGSEFHCDKLILAGGVYNQHWREILAPERESLSKTAPGSYLEFSDVSFNLSSFSLTLDGDNLIYDASRRRLLIGSTTESCTHELFCEREIRSIYERLKANLKLNLPEFSHAFVRTGLREKAPKREPYLIQNDNIYGIGGFYKNGYSVNLKLSKDLIQRLS